MFHAADLMLLNKTDLLPHLDFDVELCIANARKVNPKIEVMQLSATKGEGMDQWLAWIEEGLSEAQGSKQESVSRLKQQNAKLEAELSALKARLGEES